MDLIANKRVALITGGARGIGFAAARLLAAEGARIVLVDINGEGAVEGAKKLAHETGAQALGLRADIAQGEEVDETVRHATEHFGTIDILVNCAAIAADKLFLESDAGDWDRMLKICLLGPMHLLKAVLPMMAARKYGRVICVASDSARLGQARLSYYAAAKAGVIALVKSVAQEVGREGITLNVVSPGATDTELRREREESLRRQMGEEKYERRVQSILRMYPTRRLGRPEDAASMIAFLASEQASWITGQVLSVNGGFAMP